MRPVLWKTDLRAGILVVVASAADGETLAEVEVVLAADAAVGEDMAVTVDTGAGVGIAAAPALIQPVGGIGKILRGIFHLVYVEEKILYDPQSNELFRLSRVLDNPQLTVYIVDLLE